MPFKVCPKCNAKTGARRLVCECGHDFGCKRSGKHAIAPVAPVEVHESGEPVEPGKRRRRRKKQGAGHEFPYPEPGAWIWDRPKGMPPINPPSALPSGLLPTGVIKAQVSYEGLGFCLYSFIKAERIADPQLRELWAKTRAGMQEIVMYLDKVPWDSGEEEPEESEEPEEEDEEPEEEDDAMPTDV